MEIVPITDKNARVVHFHRKPMEGAFSIEDLFLTLQFEMQRRGWQVDRFQMPYYSRGVVPRFRNVLATKRHQGAVNHIAGDVHYIAMGLPKQNTILTIHDLEMLNRMQGLKRWIFVKLWFDLPIRRVRYVTTISNATKEKLVSVVPIAENKISVIPDVVSPRYKPCPRSSKNSIPLILTIGTKPNKNLVRLSQALSGLDANLRIIGRPSEEQIRTLKDHQITFSWRANLTDDEMIEEYKNADVVALVSTEEGFGMPILEAQWIERPVITSNCSSMIEVANGSACLVNPFDVQSIRQGLQAVLYDEPYQEFLVQQGRENRSRFDIGRVASQYLDLYTSIREMQSCMR